MGKKKPNLFQSNLTAVKAPSASAFPIAGSKLSEHRASSVVGEALKAGDRVFLYSVGIYLRATSTHLSCFHSLEADQVNVPFKMWCPEGDARLQMWSDLVKACREFRGEKIKPPSYQL